MITAWQRNARLRWLPMTASVGLFVLSLFRNTLLIDGGAGPGWQTLAFGWLGLIAVPQFPANAAWLANPSVVLAWLASARRRDLLGGVFAVIALLLALLPLVSTSVAVDEGGTPRAIDGYASGYWLWLAAMVIAVIAALATPARSRV